MVSNLRSAKPLGFETVMNYPLHLLSGQQNKSQPSDLCTFMKILLICLVTKIISSMYNYEEYSFCCLLLFRTAKLLPIIRRLHPLTPLTVAGR